MLFREFEVLEQAENGWINRPEMDSNLLTFGSGD
jgi:hypothetical protein